MSEINPLEPDYEISDEVLEEERDAGPDHEAFPWDDPEEQA